jgi:4-amino-4-deoxy-L-arabinose transferase-like glycosyltransferase
MLTLKEKVWLFSLFIGSLVLWLMFLGNSPLRDWDEGTYAIVAREIYRTGNWLYPTLQGEPFLLKPPLMQWLIALSYHVGGIQEFTTRFPGAVLTALSVPLLYLLGRLLFLESLPALFTALVYLTMLPVVRHGRLAMLDGMTVFFFLLLLYCLLKSRQNPRYALGIGFCLGLITLTKGVIVLLLGAIACLFLIANGQLGLLTSPYLWIGMVFGNGPAIAWYFAQWQHYGNTFLQVYFQSQSFDRLGKAVEGHSGPPWYYLMELIKYGFPWLLFLPGGLDLSRKNFRTPWGSLILIATIGYFGTISVMSTKLPWYIFPVYPFLALAVGVKLSDIWVKSQFKGRFWCFFLALIAVAALGGCGYFIQANPQIVLIVMSLVLCLTMGVASWLVNQSDRRFILVLFAGMYIVLALLMSSQSWIWELNEVFPVKPVAALIRENITPKDNVQNIIYTSFAYNRPSLDFYCDCKVVSASLPDLKQMWSHKSYLLLDSTALNNIGLPGIKNMGKVGNFTLIAPPN